MTDAELDALQAKLARQVTIKMCLQANDAIAALRGQVAAKDAELGRLRSGHETFLWKRAVENADREKKETVDAFMLLSDKHTLMTERAEAAEADNATLRSENARLLQEVLSPGTIPFNWQELEADNAALRSTLKELRIRFHAMGRRPEECYEMSMIDAALLAGKEVK